MKNFEHINIIAITGARSISCPDLPVKYLVGMGMQGCGGNKQSSSPKLSCFVNADELV